MEILTCLRVLVVEAGRASRAGVAAPPAMPRGGDAHVPGSSWSLP